MSIFILKDTLQLIASNDNAGGSSNLDTNYYTEVILDLIVQNTFLKIEVLFLIKLCKVILHLKYLTTTGMISKAVSFLTCKPVPKM